MDELIKTVAERLGIPEDKARMAVDLVVNHLKTQLPAPLAGQIDSALSGGGASAALGSLGSLGGLLGGKS